MLTSADQSVMSPLDVSSRAWRREGRSFLARPRSGFHVKLCRRVFTDTHTHTHAGSGQAKQAWVWKRLESDMPKPPSECITCSSQPR
eukprot:14489484-Alexandrium_andersonii.AAC.1